MVRGSRQGCGTQPWAEGGRRSRVARNKENLSHSVGSQMSVFISETEWYCLKLQEWGDSLGAMLQRVDSGSLSLGQAGGRNSCSQEPSSLMVTRAYPRGAGGSLGRRKESEE